MPDRPRDREREEALGMNRQIDRREFIDGILIGASAITASGWLVACTPDGGTAEATATAAVTGRNRAQEGPLPTHPRSPAFAAARSRSPR